MENKDLCNLIYETAILYKIKRYKQIIDRFYYNESILSILREDKDKTMNNIRIILSSKEKTKNLMLKVDYILEDGPIGEIDETVMFYIKRCPIYISKEVVKEKFFNKYNKYWKLYLKAKKLDEDLFEYYKKKFI